MQKITQQESHRTRKYPPWSKILFINSDFYSEFWGLGLGFRRVEKTHRVIKPMWSWQSPESTTIPTKLAGMFDVVWNRTSHGILQDIMTRASLIREPSSFLFRNTNSGIL